MSSSAKALNDFSSALAGIASASAKNTAQSQDFAREQMAFQQASNEQAMAHSSAEAQKNRDWQTQMSNTAHQREVKDLIAAGLNPVLSANAGASTPSGATGSGFSSSGASGQVDSSYVNAMASIFAQQLAMKNNIDIARINQETQLESAKLGYDAALGTAAISASTQKYINDNPNSIAGSVVSALTGRNSSARDVADKFGILSAFKNTINRVKNSSGNVKTIKKNSNLLQRLTKNIKAVHS